MRRLAFLIAALPLACQSPPKARATAMQTAHAPAADADGLAGRWLFRDCAVDEKELERELLDAGVESDFIRALEEGPPPKKVANILDLATIQWQLCQLILEQDNVAFGLRKPEREIAQGMTLEESIESAKTDFVGGYEYRAISALSLVGREKALESLQRFVAQKDDGVPIRRHAEEAIAAIRQRLE